MKKTFFDSTAAGMVRYFVRPNDDFVLNSLEKINSDEYLYRLLKEDGYERVVFFEVDETNCKVFAYDKLSHLSLLNPADFRLVNISDAESLKLFYDSVKNKNDKTSAGPAGLTGSLRGKASNVSEIKEYGKREVTRFAQSANFLTVFENYVSNALQSDNIKTAIVMQMEIFEQTFHKEVQLANKTSAQFVDIIRKNEKINTAKQNIIVFTTTSRDSFWNLFNNSLLHNLHPWIAEVLREQSNVDRVQRAINKLEEYGCIVLADSIGEDELANLLLRKKYIENDERFQEISATKIYVLASMLKNHLLQKNNYFQTIPYRKVKEFVRPLNAILEKQDTVDELVNICSGLKPRRINKVCGESSVSLERVTHRSVQISEMSREERMEEYNAALSRLNKLIGLDNVKLLVQQLFDRKLAYSDESGPGHYIFSGNPGTGKTEVARLMGDIFRAQGLLNSGHVVEVRGGDLIAEHVGGSAPKTRKICESALDGVLFVDEAYLLVNTEATSEKFPNQFAEEAYTEIMAFMENNRDRICMIFAGYSDKMRLFIKANPGMESRISKTIEFPDYSVVELYDIFRLMAKNDGFTLSENLKETAMRVIEYRKNNVDSATGNARIIRKLLNECKDSVSARVALLLKNKKFDQAETEKYIITSFDFPDDNAGVSNDDFEYAMNRLNDLVGLQKVKSMIQTTLETKLTYADEEGPGHYIFAGSPGTGKTEVARLLGKIFKAQGLLKKGHLVECGKADLVSDHVGGSAIKARNKCQEALDGVLFVDEAYNLVNTEPTGEKFSSKFDEEAYTEIMAFMENNRRRICVIFAGYSDKMQIFVNANPGMPDRITEVISFPDYTEKELFDIFVMIAKKEGFAVMDDVMPFAIKAIQKIKNESGETFSNARAMRKLFEESKKNIATRMAVLRKEKRFDEIDKQKYIITCVDIPGGNNTSSIDNLSESMAELNELIGLADVKSQISSIANRVRFSTNTNKKVIPGHYVFVGKPGTGKTEVARLFSKILFSIGVLSKGHIVEVTRSDLVAGYVGQTAIKTEEKCKQALGGVLFVDEAYTLFDQQGSSFGTEALETIMKFMEDNRENFTVIFAGYADRMQELMSVNAGFSSRISSIITFPDYSADELVQIMKLMASKKNLQLENGFVEESRKVFSKWISANSPTFGNARDVRKYLEKADENRANRIAHTVENGEAIEESAINCLITSDSPVKSEHENDSKTPAKSKRYKRISQAIFENLPEPYGIEATASRIKLNETTDPAILFVKTDKGAGTAFLVSPDGYAITCNHVIEGATEITARLRILGRPGGSDSFYKCEVVNTKKDYDIALIKLLDGTDFPYLKLADCNRKIIKGEEFLLSGYPFGDRTAKDLTTFYGSIASSELQKDDYGYIRFNIDCQAKCGDSGAPIIATSDGCVIGILLGSITNSSEQLVEEINHMRPIKYFWEEFLK